MLLTVNKAIQRSGSMVPRCGLRVTEHAQESRVPFGEPQLTLLKAVRKLCRRLIWHRKRRSSVFFSPRKRLSCRFPVSLLLTLSRLCSQSQVDVLLRRSRDERKLLAKYNRRENMRLQHQYSEQRECLHSSTSYTVVCEQSFLKQDRLAEKQNIWSSILKTVLGNRFVVSRWHHLSSRNILSSAAYSTRTWNTARPALGCSTFKRILRPLAHYQNSRR